MRVLRTPDDRFAGLAEFPFPPRYVEIDGELRIHYLDEGPADGPLVLLMHGEPSWCFLYRRVIPVLVAAGCHVVAPDLVGFGRSDKPGAVADHSYTRHVEWMRAALFDALDLRDVTLVGQDWGGLIGLRLVAEHPDRFARVVATNTGLPDGRHRLPDPWWRFRDFVVGTPDLPVGFLVGSGCQTELAPDVAAAYDAPFPGPDYQAGPHAMPDLIHRHRTTRRHRPKSEPGRHSASSTSRSSARSATATRSRPASTSPCGRASRARRPTSR